VGTIIVAAVVIIFLPDLLDGEKKTHQTDFEAIPTAPVFSGELSNKAFPEQSIQKKVVAPIIDEQAQDDYLVNTVENEVDSSVGNNLSKVTPALKTKTIKVVDNNIDVTKTNQVDKILEKTKVIAKKVVTKPLPPKAIVKEAWVIHLGSFKHKQNVAQLLAKLKTNGYIAFTRPIKTKHGILTKVFIGPELIKSSLDKKIPALKKLTNTLGKVAPFYPDK